MKLKEVLTEKSYLHNKKSISFHNATSKYFGFIKSVEVPTLSDQYPKEFYRNYFIRSLLDFNFTKPNHAKPNFFKEYPPRTNLHM